MKMLTGNRNQCQVCKEYFNSNSPFDKHRIGKYGVNRRCLTPDEMIAKGMSVNAAGFWITEKRDWIKDESKDTDQAAVNS